MAKKRGRAGPSPAELRRLEALPQRYEAWQVGGRQLDVSVQEGGKSLRPWVLLVASGEGLILASEVSPGPPGPAQAWAALARGMSSPLAGEPHLPTTVQFADAGWAEALRAPLEALNVAAEVTELEGIEEALEGLNSNVRGGPPAGLLDAEGVTPELVGGVFDAAAVFYQQAPWKRVGERAVEVRSDRLEGGPRYAVMMGQAGLTAGLVLYDDYETLVHIREEDLPPGEAAAITAALAVIFGSADDLVPADVEAMREHHWRVAGPHAYPCIYRMEPGMVMRPPAAAELELLEGCLRALPEFARKKTRRLGPAPLTVPGATGDVALVLAWADG
jgi:hypothetical protein